MQTHHFISGFIRCVVQQREEELLSFFTPNAEVIWPCTNESFTGPEYAKVNCIYPGDWQGEVGKVRASGNEIVAVSKIFSNEAAFYVTSFITLEGQKIQRLEEYWSDIGEPPQWRKALKKELDSLE